VSPVSLGIDSYSVRMEITFGEISLIIRFLSLLESQGSILSLKMGVRRSSRKVSVL
jgi:hypothetical protein